MTESVSAHNSLVRLDQKTGQLTYQSAGFINLLGINTGSQAEEVPAGFDSHYHFLK